MNHIGLFLHTRFPPLSILGRFSTSCNSSFGDYNDNNNYNNNIIDFGSHATCKALRDYHFNNITKGLARRLGVRQFP